MSIIVYSGIQQPTIGLPSVQSASLVADYAKDNKESAISIAVKDTIDCNELQEGAITTTIGVVFKPRLASNVEVVDSETVAASKPTKQIILHQQHVATWAANLLLCLSQQQQTEQIEPAKGLHANIYVKAKDKLTGELLSIVFKDKIPANVEYLIKACSQGNVWEFNLIHNDCPVSTSLFSQAQVVASQAPRTVSHSKLHDMAGITLYKEQVIVCPITGISYLAKLPTTNKMHMLVNHPLSVYSNVEQIINGYYKSGVKLEDTLENQVLAGMLITILKEKGLVFNIKDSKRSNMFLSQASKDTLSYAVRYFYSLSMVTNRPYLSMNLEDHDYVFANLYKGQNASEVAKLRKEAELYILNYVRACKGESVKDRYILPPVAKTKAGSEKVRAKLFTDKVKQEVYEAKDNQVRAKRILSILPVNDNAIFIEVIKAKIDMMMYISPEDRQKIQKDIQAKWLGNALASKLADCFAITTSAVEDDLFSFTQEIEREQNTKPKTEKVDFMSLVNKTNKE